MQEASDPQQLETLKHELDAAQVYHWSEVEAFARVFYKLPAKQMAQDHARMQRHLQPAVDRFKALENDDQRSEFREKLKGFVHIYSFLSQVIPYGDPVLEMLYSFGRLLLPHLPLEGETERVKLGDEVDLEYYRLQRVYSGEIDLNEGDSEGVKSPTDVGTGKAKEDKAPLSEIIEVLNERFGTNFSEEDRLFFEQIKEKAVKNPKFIDTALSNPLDKFQLGIRKLLESLMIERLGENDDIVTRYMEDGAFQGAAFPILAKEIFDKIQANAGRQSIEQIVAAGESNTVEFKSTLRVNLHTGQNDPKMEQSALKTIAAFLNSREGGTLVIGVNDDGVALGVETDKFPNEDKMNLHLGNLIKTRLGTGSMLNIKPHFESFQEKRVLVVDCAASGVPVYYKDGKEEEFYIRAGASTAALPPSEMNTYIKQRFL